MTTGTHDRNEIEIQKTEVVNFEKKKLRLIENISICVVALILITKLTRIYSHRYMQHKQA